MEQEKTLAVRIDVSGVREGGRVVKREFVEIGKGAQAAERSTDRFGRRTVRALREVGESATVAGRSVRVFSNALSGLVAGALAAFSFGQAISTARTFNAALAEVSTLLPLTNRQLAGLGDQAREFAKTFGTDASTQVKGFYQSISSGASSVQEAAAILEQANKLAIGGVTNVETAVDGLTTAVNAYASSGLTAAQAADAMFVGVRAGKTTAAQLSAALGAVVPIASSLGVSFDELIAGTAALTTQGQSTAMAITGIRAALTQVTKPTKEARDLAAQLGIEFDAAALKSKGFAGFIQDIIKKTGGSNEKLAQLFGSVEALNAVLSFAGGGGEKFTQILDQMANKAGAADEAYKKMADSLSQRWNVIMAKAENVVLSVGRAILAVLVPSIETLIESSRDIATTLGVVATGLSLAFAPQILAAMAAGFIAFSTTVVGGISAITIAIAANPMGALIVAITAAAAAAYAFRDQINQAIGVDVAAVFKRTANYIIGAFFAVFEDIKFVWSGFGNMFGAAVVAGVNVAIDALNALIDGAKTGINSVISMINQIPGVDIGTLDTSTSTIDRITADFQEKAAASIAARNSAVKSAMERDYIGEWFGSGTDSTGSAADAIKAVQDAAKSASDALAGAADAGSTAGDAIKGGADKASDAWKGLRKATSDTLQMIRDATNTLGQTMGGIFKGLLDKTLTWKDAALEALKSVLLYMNQMNLAKGGSGLFGGGFFQSLIGGFLGIGFAKGGVFGPGGLTPFARGGVVNSPTVFPFKNGTGLMGEAGPEAIMPLKRGRNGVLGVQMANDNRWRRQAVSVSVGVTVDNDGNLKAYVKNVAQTEAATAAGKVGQAMPLIAQQTQRNTEMRRIAPTRRMVG